MGPGDAFFIIVIVSLVTLYTRITSFMVFPNAEKAPKAILYLGRFLPTAIIGMLIVYSIRDIRMLTVSYWMPEIIAIAIVAVLHIWKKNSLISICGGTAVYMVLIQFIFV